jgi:hypothetical protein
MRKSFQFARAKVNHKIWDVAETGIIGDPFHSETGSAISNIDSGRSGHTQSTGSLPIGKTIRDDRSGARSLMGNYNPPNLTKPAILKLVYVHNSDNGTLNMVEEPGPGDAMMLMLVPADAEEQKKNDNFDTTEESVISGSHFSQRPML